MIILFICVLISITVLNNASSDFSLKGDPCSKFDSCFAKPHLRTCSCDDDCQFYGICCHDFKKQQQDFPSNTYSCYSRFGVTPVFAKRSCSEDFLGHIDDRIACLDDDVDEMDVKNNLLLTSHKTKITYWNKFCAKCNNEYAEDLEFWNIEVYCPQHKNVDRSLIRRNLTYDHDKKQWGLEIDDEFLQCIVKYAPPPYIDEVKPCTSNIISSCPLEYKNEEVVMKCLEYYGERKDKFSNIVYKNIHCAICNGAEVTELECPGMAKPEDVDETDFREMVEEVFTNGRWLHKKPGKLFECSRGHSYDAFQVRCRRDELLDATTEVPISFGVAKEPLSVLIIVLFIVFSFLCS